MEVIKHGIIKISGDCIIDRLITDAIITNDENNISSKVLSLWDTGATRTCIHPRLLNKLGLENQHIGYTNLSGYFGHGEQQLFHAKIDFYDKISFYGDVAVMPYETEEFDLVIGTDIISKGNFMLINFEDKTELCFECPPKFGLNSILSGFKTKE